MKKTISTKEAPAAIGPYSQAVQSGNMLFVSGQIPLDAKSGEIIGATVKEQTIKVLHNLQQVIKAAGFATTDVVKTTCYLKDMNSFVEMNTEYAKVFTENFPARAAVEVSRLPKDVLVEIDAIAMKD